MPFLQLHRNTACFRHSTVILLQCWPHQGNLLARRAIFITGGGAWTGPELE